MLRIYDNREFCQGFVRTETPVGPQANKSMKRCAGRQGAIEFVVQAARPFFSFPVSTPLTSGVYLDCSVSPPPSSSPSSRGRACVLYGGKKIGRCRKETRANVRSRKTDRIRAPRPCRSESGTQRKMSPMSKMSPKPNVPKSKCPQKSPKCPRCPKCPRWALLRILCRHGPRGGKDLALTLVD